MMKSSNRLLRELGPLADARVDFGIDASKHGVELPPGVYMETHVPYDDFVRVSWCRLTPSGAAAAKEQVERLLSLVHSNGLDEAVVSFDAEDDIEWGSPLEAGTFTAEMSQIVVRPNEVWFRAYGNDDTLVETDNMSAAAFLDALQPDVKKTVLTPNRNRLGSALQFAVQIQEALALATEAA